MEEELSKILKNNRTDDITWFCSLTESELDLLISLKKLVIQRAKISGHEELAGKFDLKMLRALGLVLMEYVRKRVHDDASLATSAVYQLRLLDNCNLLKTHVDDTIDVEKILTEICNNNSKRKARKRLVVSLNSYRKDLTVFLAKYLCFPFVFQGGGRTSCCFGVKRTVR
ncbi:hypothetical protein V5N11_015720 [Cardamine amara subsp. amara]|uniref:Uncharacterized protein n=1 Tax=Cardamine amara subsp. amara TaxID=228776 RepID=A0ABD1A695_CARAN